MTQAERIAHLLYLLARRDSEGHPQPRSLADLRAAVDAPPRTLQRDLRAIRRSPWVLHRQSIGSGSSGRAPEEAVLLWVDLPGNHHDFRILSPSRACGSAAVKRAAHGSATRPRTTPRRADHQGQKLS